MDTTARHRILIVEDDATMLEMLQINLEIEGYDTLVAHTAEEALTLPLEGLSLILLDVMMGAMNGFALARHLKENAATAHVPIIFCTARDSEDDMIMGLGLGADDYICKPYSLRNVLARVRTVLRRGAVPHPATATPIHVDDDTELLVNGALTLEHRFKRCLVDGRDARLVRKEYEVLYLLMSNPGRLFSREEILRRVWKNEVVVLDRTVDVNITRIRRKIEPWGKRIVTRQGYGYGFE